MRILLIEPPWLNIYGDFQSTAKLAAVSPPLTLAYLAGVALSAGADCQILDAEMEGLDQAQLLQRIREYKPDMIGLTSTTPAFGNAESVAGGIKKIFPRLPICLGGIHATVLGRQILEQSPSFDFLVLGEGEETFREVIGAFQQNRSLDGIAGVIFRKNGAIVENPPRPLIANLDSLPMPARHLLKKELYFHNIPGRRHAMFTSLFSSRGCPFQCLFCGQHHLFSRQMRYHGIARVINELKDITENLDIRHVIFVDDTLTLNKQHMFELCEAIRREKLRFTWEGWTHAGTVDGEILSAMKEAGLVRLSFGIESGDPEILKHINKQVTVEQIRKAYRLAKQAGIETRGSVILGHPFETRGSAWRTIRFIRSLRDLDHVYLNVACPYPGSELYDWAVSGKGGLKLLSTDYTRYQRYGVPVISVNDLSAQALRRLRTIGVLYFYLTPRRIWYNVVKRSGLRAGLTNVIAFIKVILRSFFTGNQGRETSS